jgi:hypothetical protein
MTLHTPSMMTSGKPSFELFKSGTGNLPSVARLDMDLEINSTTVQPTFVYSGGDADGTNWDPWQFGGILTYNAGGGAASFNQGSPLLGANDDSVLFDGNAYYTGPDNSFADITTEDIVFEIILSNGTNNERIIEKRDVGGTDFGWDMANVANNIMLYLKNTDGNANVQSAALVTGVWYHLMCFVNRDEASANGSQWYVNGVASGVFRVNTYATGGDGGTPLVAGDCVDGVIHSLRFRWETDNVICSRDGTDGAADGSADMPDDLDRIDVGTDTNQTNGFNGIISDFKIWSFITLKS